MEEFENNLRRKGFKLSSTTNRLKNGEEMSSWEFVMRVELDGVFFIQVYVGNGTVEEDILVKK